MKIENMRFKKLFFYMLSLIPIILLILGYIYQGAFFQSQEEIRTLVLSYGKLAPIIFILIQIIQVIVTPISHYTISIAGGYIFGTFEGFIYNLIGRVIGTFLAFYIGRRVGRKYIQKFISSDIILKYDKLFNKNLFVLFLVYYLPLFPDDEISYLAGISKIKFKVFSIIAFMGHIGGSLSLAYLGNGIKSFKEPAFIVLSIVTLFFGFLFILYCKRANNNSCEIIDTQAQ